MCATSPKPSPRCRRDDVKSERWIHRVRAEFGPLSTLNDARIADIYVAESDSLYYQKYSYDSFVLSETSTMAYEVFDNKATRLGAPALTIATD